LVGGTRLAVRGDRHLTAAGDAITLDLIREGGNRTGEFIVGLVSIFTLGMVAIGGGVTGLGYTLLPTVRPQVHRQSLPLATGNLPTALRELGPTAGVIGVPRLISDHSFSPA
jgi:predicted NBD/HSP70 family sugar kinase